MSYSTKYVAALFCTLPFFAQNANAKEKKKSYEKSVFSNYQSLPANTPAIEKTKAKAADAFPGWTATTDKVNGSITDLYGKSITLAGTTNKDKAAGYIAQRLKDFGFKPGEWLFTTAPSAPKADYVNYTQSIGSHKVIFSKLSFRFTKDGNLSRIEAKNYGSPVPGTAPTISKNDALALALKDIDGVNITESAIENDWVWFPIPSANKYTLHPAWKFRIKGKVPGSIPANLSGYVDALTGEILYRTNEVRETGYDLSVKGMVYKNNTVTPATLEPLSDLTLVIAGIPAYITDASGRYVDPFLLTPAATDIPLSGLWSEVIDDPTSTTPVVSTMVSSPSVYTYPATGLATNSHINAYYHTTRVHNFMKSWFTTFTSMDSPLPTMVDVPGACNAFYSGTAINFYAAGSGCSSFAEIADIVYHEYGHGINENFYNFIAGIPMMNGALHEGYADVWAMSITHEPFIGKNAFAGGGLIRRYDNTPQVYPIDLQFGGSADPHKNAQIIAGAWWDLAVNLGNVDTMVRLFTDVYYDAPDAPDGAEGSLFQTILTDALLADDNDANLANGTPHYNQIVAAFAKHGIYREGDMEFLSNTTGLEYEEINKATAGIAIPVNARLTMTDATPFKDLTLYYRTNSTGSWNSLLMTQTGSNFSGSIPAQSPGTTVEYYFVAHDILDVANAYFPITCNPTLPSSQTTIPYQFAVGIKAVDSNDFETPASVTGYAIGGNPGDDATFLTRWKRTIPAGIPGDHTSGAGQCLQASAMSSTMMRGTTTVITPAFSISSLAEPIIQYYRWYTNEQGYRNFKTDPWIVKIRDASASSWQTLEYTYQGERNWRRRIFRAKSFVPATTTQIQLKFFASDSVITTLDDDGQGILAAGIDDIYIYDKAKTSVEETAHQPAQVYPNPADGLLYITLPVATAGTLSIWDISGKKLDEVKLNDNTRQYSFRTDRYADGMYQIMIEGNNGIEIKKVTIAHQH
jgi:hypothetical protein